MILSLGCWPSSLSDVASLRTASQFPDVSFWRERRYRMSFKNCTHLRISATLEFLVGRSLSYCFCPAGLFFASLKNIYLSLSVQEMAFTSHSFDSSYSIVCMQVPCILEYTWFGVDTTSKGISLRYIKELQNSFGIAVCFLSRLMQACLPQLKIKPIYLLIRSRKRQSSRRFFCSACCPPAALVPLVHCYLFAVPWG